MKDLFENEIRGDVADYYTRCGDCGIFLKKERWVKKDNTRGYTKALCGDCLSSYEW
jgi:hypothetical protein